MRRRRLSKKRRLLLFIFFLLIVSNISFYGLLLNYYYYNHPNLVVNWGMLNNIICIVATIIILGFISTRLPQFRKMGDSSIYEMSYLIILGLLSIVVSYFNKTTNVDSFLGPFLEIFKVLSILLLLLIIATKSKAFQSIISRKVGRKALIYCFIIFAIIGCVSSVYYTPVHGSMVTVRELVVMISGLFAGPYVGIPVGVIAGVFSLFYNHTATSIPCMVSTIIAGILGSILYVCNDRKFLRGFPAALLMFLYSGFMMLLIILFTPENISIPYINDIYLLTAFSSVLGMVLFKMIVKEEKTGESISYEELRINELENTLEEYEDRMDNLEEDIRFLKRKVMKKQKKNK